jgi:hypothetical protein
VSILTSESAVDVAPSTLAMTPRFKSAVGPVMIAPRSVYVLPTCTVAGLLPLTEMTGALEVAMGTIVFAAAAEARSVSSCDLVTHVCAPDVSATQSFCVSTSFAWMMVAKRPWIPACENHWVSAFSIAARKSCDKVGVEEVADVEYGKLVMHPPLRQNCCEVVVVAVEVPIERLPAASMTTAGDVVP